VPGCVAEDWTGVELGEVVIEQPVARIKTPNNPIKLKCLMFTYPPGCRWIKTGKNGNL